MSDAELCGWTEAGEIRSARWRSENGAPPPKQILVVDDTITADDAYRLASRGSALLWRGDFQNARQLLGAMSRRAGGRRHRAAAGPADAFHLYRQEQSRRARTLGMLLVPLDPGHVLPLRRAPDVRQACTEAYGAGDMPSVSSLRELLGVIGAHEWREKGVPVPALGARIHPHHGVFSPVRGEYVRLVADTSLPSRELAFDIGTGTGVLAAVLAHRGVERIIATDQDPRAVACARENAERLGFADRMEILRADLFPSGRAPLVVCNPPWIPGRPSSPMDHAVYDPGSRMLRGFLNRLRKHLRPEGEGWLILSDLAEHLELRTRAELLAAIDEAGLRVKDRSEVKPDHSRVSDRADPLHAARSKEMTSLWRLIAR